MKIILFVGGSGLLGQTWIKSFNNKFKIYAIKNRNNISVRKKNLIKIKLKNFNYKNLNEIVRKKKIDSIINVAGLTSIEECENNKKKAFKSNVAITKLLHAIAIKNDLKFLHMSTDHIFGGKSKGFYSENSKPNPVNNYAKTKLKAENLIKNYKKALIIRANFFGGSTKYRKSFSGYILSNIKKNKCVSLWSDVFFTPVNINFLIRTIHMLIDKNVYGIINISSSNSISKYSFGIKLCQYLKLDKKYILKKKQTTKTIIRPKNMSLSNKKLFKIFPELKNKLSLKYQIKNIYNYSDTK